MYLLYLWIQRIRDNKLYIFQILIYSFRIFYLLYLPSCSQLCNLAPGYLTRLFNVPNFWVVINFFHTPQLPSSSQFALKEVSLNDKKKTFSELKMHEFI